LLISEKQRSVLFGVFSPAFPTAVKNGIRAIGFNFESQLFLANLTLLTLGIELLSVQSLS
jgi:hypothetical protein